MKTYTNRNQRNTQKKTTTPFFSLTQQKSKTRESKDKATPFFAEVAIQQKPIFDSNNGTDTQTPPLERKLNTSKGKGKPLPKDVRSDMESAFETDFSNVRIHTDQEAMQLSEELQARAFTNGHDIYFNENEFDTNTKDGKKLLAHELTHVNQQKGSGVLQKLGVDDVAQEMNGRTFRVVVDEGGIKAGTQIVITDWRGTDRQAIGYYIQKDGTRINTAIRKHVLTPVNPGARGIRTYNTGLAGQRTSVERSYQSVEEQETEVANWRARESQYQSNRHVWEDGLARLEAELARRQGLLDRRETTMSRMLVRETMYNRFDALIVQWVNHYNAQFSPADNLDPNVVKSLLFQETRMGTSGTHLELPPYSFADSRRHPVRSRFNLGQTIDSWGPQQYLMIKEMAPEIYKRHGLHTLEARAAWRGMSNSDYATWNGGVFMTAMQEFFTERNAGNNLIGNTGIDLHMDYEFWIRATVRWLFLKYQSLSSPSWSEAVRAYNGSGSRARAYRDSVIGRTGSQTNLDVGNN